LTTQQERSAFLVFDPSSETKVIEFYLPPKAGGTCQLISPGLDLVRLERKVTDGSDGILLRSSLFLNTLASN